MIADWDAYRFCPVCRVGLGKPCVALSGRRVDSDCQVVVTAEPRDRPHSSRDLRTGGGGPCLSRPKR